MEEIYFLWLCGLVSSDKHRHVMEALFDSDYEWYIPNDDNRASDGLGLRNLFADETRDDSILEWLSPKPCSMLEMMIALAKRIEDHILDEPADYWFYIMLKNSGLYEYVDDNFDLEAVYDIIERINNRTYDRNGNGGLFPLSNVGDIPGNTIMDQRKVEIWYQMQYFIQENYYNFDY